MKIKCPNCGADGEGLRFVKRHFLEELCKEHREYNKRLAEVRVDVDATAKDTPEIASIRNALRKK